MRIFGTEGTGHVIILVLLFIMQIHVGPFVEPQCEFPLVRLEIMASLVQVPHVVIFGDVLCKQNHLDVNMTHGKIIALIGEDVHYYDAVLLLFNSEFFVVGL